MTRVLHVITTLGLGGAERMLSSLVTARSPVDITHAVASLIPGGVYAGELREAGIPVTELAVGPWPPNPWPVTTLARLIRRVQPHIVQGWMYHGDLLATLALILSGAAAGRGSRGRSSAPTWIPAATGVSSAS